MQMISAYLMWRGYGSREAGPRAASILKDLNIYGERDKRIGELSGGTKRKVLVWCVLASDAEIIFLDEPTTSLDLISRGMPWKTFPYYLLNLRLAEGKVFVIIHQVITKGP